MRTYRSALFALLLSTSYACAFDWTQPILDENGKTIPDCPGKDLEKDTCNKVLSIGTLTARALLIPPIDPNDARKPPEQKAIEGNFALQIILHPDLGPTPDELKLACDAIGKMPSPLAVARGWALLGCKTSVK
jgi:hypothetical protein